MTESVPGRRPEPDAGGDDFTIPAENIPVGDFDADWPFHDSPVESSPVVHPGARVAEAESAAHTGGPGQSAAGTSRRTPTQDRSKKRVSQILACAQEVVLEVGVERLTTRDIAHRAKIPVGSLYQYFKDKDEILTALVRAAMDEMDEQVFVDLATVPELTLDSLVRSVFGSFRTVYQRRQDFVVIYLRGRNQPAIARYGHEHNNQVAALLREAVVADGLVSEGLTLKAAEVLLELGDRIFQLAYQHSFEGDVEIIEQGMIMIVNYLRLFAPPRSGDQ